MGVMHSFQVNFFSKIQVLKEEFLLEKKKKLELIDIHWYFDKRKSFWKFMIVFCYFYKKKMTLILGVTFFCPSRTPQAALFRGFCNIFFSLHISLKISKEKPKWMWYQWQSWRQSRSHEMKIAKRKHEMRFFREILSYFPWGTHIKA